jgi:hypothetical protein
LLRDLRIGSVEPVAVKRAISTESLRLSVCSSIKEIGFLLELGLELALGLELELLLELALGLELELRLALGLELELELELALGLALELDVNPSVGTTLRASFWRKRRFFPISSISRTLSCGGLYSFALRNKSSAFTV